MKTVNANELRNVNGGYYYHCAWCCGRGKNVDFYTKLGGYLHTKTAFHKKWWNNGHGPSRGKCAHTGGY